MKNLCNKTIWFKSLAIVIVGLFSFQQIGWTAYGGDRQRERGKIEMPMVSPDKAQDTQNRMKDVLEQKEEITPEDPDDLPEELLKIATQYLKETLNPDDFKLIDWIIDGKIVSFIFKLPEDDSRIEISVHIETGEVLDNPECDAALEARKYIAENMGVDIKEVHINGIIGLADSGPNTGYTITARLENYTIILDYKIGYAIEPIQTQIILKHFIDNKTGEDLFENAIDYLKDQFDPDKFKLIRWTYGPGIILFSKEMLQFVFKLGDGSLVCIAVDLETGDPSLSWTATPVSEPHPLPGQDEPQGINPVEEKSKSTTIDPTTGDVHPVKPKGERKIEKTLPGRNLHSKEGKGLYKITVQREQSQIADSVDKTPPKIIRESDLLNRRSIDLGELLREFFVEF